MNDPDPDREAPLPARRSARISTVIGLVIGVLGAVFVARAIVAEWDVVRAALAQASVGWLLAALVVAAASMTGIGLAWGAALRLVGVDAARAASLFWYFVGQLGKYVPGGIWPVVGRAEMARRDGVARPRSYGAVLLSLGATYLAAVVTVALLVPLEPAVAGAAGAALWVLVLLPVGFAVVHPAVLRRILDLVRRVSGRELEMAVPPWRSSAGLVAAHVPSWLGIGLATWCVARAFDVSPPVGGVVIAAVLSWVVGFVVVPVPGGIGVREAVFTAAAAATVLSSGIAATVAVVARVVFMLVDASGAGVTALVRRRSGRPVNGRSRSSPGGPPPAPPSGS